MCKQCKKFERYYKFELCRKCIDEKDSEDEKQEALGQSDLNQLLAPKSTATEIIGADSEGLVGI